MARESAKRQITVVPYQKPDDRLGVIRGNKYRRIPPKIVNDKGGIEVLDSDNFAERFPQLAEAARNAAIARLAFYGLPQEELDKWHGWIEDPSFNPELSAKFPEQLRNELDYDPNGKFYKLKKESKVLDSYDPEQVAAIMQVLAEDFPEGIPSETALKHVLKSDVPAGTQFYPSTQQYLNDVLFAGGFADSDPVIEATYDLARKYLADMLIRDTELPPESRKYSKNARKMLGKGDDEDYTLGDLKSHFQEGLFGPAGEFDATPGMGYWLQGMFDPARAAVTQDPELEKKSSTAEKTARTVYDIGKLATMARLPELATQGLAKAGVPFAAHPVLTRTGLGGVVGALMSPADYFIGDPLFEKATGYGVTHYPFDLANVAADALIGAGLSAAGGMLNPIGNARYTARNAMVNQPAGSEALGALKAEAKSRGLKPHRMGKLVDKKMLNDELSGVPHNPPRGSGERGFAEKAFEDYDKNWNTMWKVELMPKPEVKLEEGAVELKPYGETGVPGTYGMTEPPMLATETESVKYSKPRFNNQTQMEEYTMTRKTGDGRDEKYVIPRAYGKPTKQFTKRYLEQNPRLMEDMPAEFETDVQDWLGQVVPYGNYPERQWFYGNKPIFMTDDERRVLQNMARDNGGALRAKATYVDRNKQLGNKNKKTGKWEPATDEQTAAYEKAKAEYKLRFNMKELTPEEIAMYKAGHVRGPIRRGADIALTGLVRPAAVNLYPTGSKIADKLTGTTTIPYSYEAYPEEK